MEYTLALQVSDQSWAGSGDEGSAAFRRPSRLTLQLQGVGVDGNPLQSTVEIQDGEPLLLQRGGHYTFRFESPSFASIDSLSLAADQGAVDGLAFDSLAIQPVPDLAGDLDLAANYQLEAVKSEGSASFTSVAPTLPGVRVDLYDGTRFETLRSTRVEQSVGLDDAYARHYNRGDSDTFSARITGEIQATVDGLNQWALLADDGVRVWIGDQLLVDQWRDQAGSWRQFSLDGLVKDEWYPLLIEYYENRGAAALRLAQANAKHDPLSPTQLRLPPESSTQIIQGLYGSLTVNRQGDYIYQPDAFNPQVRGLSADQILEDRFELQLLTPAGGTETKQLVLSLTGAADAPAFVLDFRRDGFTRVDSGQSATAYFASGKPLAVTTPEPVELRVLNVLDGDQALRTTEYGKIWFHVLDADGTRLPDSAVHLDPQLPTFFLVHGFLAGVGDEWLASLRQGFSHVDGDWKLRQDDVLPWQSQYEPNHGLALALQEAYRAENGSVAANIVMVDWGNFSGTGPDYLKTASEHVPAVGRAIADYILEHQIQPETTTLIGHSLGGHISGFAGQSIQEMAREGLFPAGTTLSRIIGMDAAGPLFNSRGPSLRLSPDDATDVFNLHTSTTFGFDAPLATYDVYINSDYDIRTPFSYSELAELGGRGQLPFFGAFALNFLFNPADILYRYHQFDLSLGQSLVDLISGIDSHSYAVAFLAALIHEDVRLSNSAQSSVPTSFTSAKDSGGSANFYESYWGNTFRTELANLQQTNDALLQAGQQPFTYSALLKGADSGGIFQSIDLPTWAPSLLPGSALDWQADASAGFGFLQPVQLDSQGFVPFSDYMLFWRNGVGIVEEDLSNYSWFYSPDFESSYLNGWTVYGPSPTLEYGLLKLGQAISDLADSASPAVEAVEQIVESVAVAVDQAASVAMQAIRSGWRLIFGGPVIDGQVFFDQRTFDQSGSLLLNSDLRINSGELQTRTDSVGRYVLNGLDNPAQFGNHDAILDYRDGLIVAGDIDPDGSISLIDSISGANMGFPLVGLPGGNASLLTTLKYAALLRWRPEWDSALIPVTPQFITDYYATLFPNTPAAFFDDSYTPYAAISSSDPDQVAEAIDVIEFTYSNLAIVKAVMELLREFGLDYGNQAAWGSNLDLDPTGSDRVEITAFSAYGFALGQRFGQNVTLDNATFNPFDRVGRPALAAQFDLDNRTGERVSHLRALIKEILAVYPTQRLLLGAPAEVLDAYKDLRTIDESLLVDAFIEERLGPFLNHFAFGLDVILQAVHTRIATAESLGREFVIPGIAGPKRLVLESLAADLVKQADAATSLPDFLPGYMKAFYRPETIDRPSRDHLFDLALSLDQQSQLSSKTWAPSDGSQLELHVSITDRDGSPQPAPDYGLSLRLRIGGTLQEGLHFYLPQELSDRTLYIPGGETSASFLIQLVAPDQLPADASLSVELLSADSGYGVDPLHAVATTVFSSSHPTVASGGSRNQFQPFALVNQTAAQSLLGFGRDVDAVATPAPMIYWANQETPNVVLRGRSGVADAFLLGRPSFGLPHIENFQPSDGDVILIDAADFTDAERSPVITDFNTYAGLVFDLVQGSPLALISDYSIESGDLPWAGLSSSAGYYRFASPEEIARSRNLIRDVADEPLPDSPSSKPSAVPRATLPNPESGSEPVDSTSVPFESKIRRDHDLQGVVSSIGRSEILALSSPGQLDVRPGELGFGSAGRDVLMAQSGTDQDQPLMLSGGSGSDTYVTASVGWTLVADVAGGRRDLLTGLTGRPSEWRWREIGGDGDLLLQHRQHGETAHVLIFDPLGDNDKAYRIERVDIAGRRKSLTYFLDRAEQQRSFGFVRLNEMSDGSLDDLFDLRHRDSRPSLVDSLEANSASLQNLASFG